MKKALYLLCAACLLCTSYAQTVRKTEALKVGDTQVVYTSLAPTIEFELTVSTDQSATITPPSKDGWTWSGSDVACDEGTDQLFTFTAISGSRLPEAAFTDHVTGNVTGCSGSGGGGNTAFDYRLVGGGVKIEPVESVIAVGESLELSLLSTQDNSEVDAGDWSSNLTSGVVMSLLSNGEQFDSSDYPISKIWFRSSVPGEYIVTAIPDEGYSSDAEADVTVYGLESLLPELEKVTEIDDGDNNDKTKSFMAPISDDDIVISAVLSPDDYDNESLPTGWEIEGGTFINNLQASLNARTYGKYEFTFDFDGLDSGYTTTVYIYSVVTDEISLIGNSGEGLIFYELMPLNFVFPEIGFQSPSGPNSKENVKNRVEFSINLNDFVIGENELELTYFDESLVESATRSHEHDDKLNIIIATIPVRGNPGTFVTWPVQFSSDEFYSSIVFDNADLSDGNSFKVGSQPVTKLEASSTISITESLVKHWYFMNLNKIDDKAMALQPGPTIPQTTSYRKFFESNSDLILKDDSPEGVTKCEVIVLNGIIPFSLHNTNINIEL